MDRFATLDEVFDHVWTRLQRAAEKPGHPCRTLTFGTAQSGAPHLRTVILRAAEPAARRLSFHTDRRSEKVKHIRASDRVAWHAWNAETREQLRLRGAATVHHDDAVADALWAAQRPSSLDVFLRSPEPGAPLDAPTDGRPEAVIQGTVTAADVEEGRAHFAVVRTVIDQIEWLHLHPKGHYRARFTCDSDATSFEGTWVAP